MTRQRLVLIAIGAALVAVGAAAWWLATRPAPSDVLTLYGNVDLRQVELAFNDSDRIEAVLAQEGDRVTRGQVLARLDVARLRPQTAVAEAQAAAQAALVAKLHAGNRPQEIAEAKNTLDAARADATNARLLYQRDDSLWSAGAGQAAVSRQDVDNARAAMDAAVARLGVARNAYELEVLGPRREDIEQAEAQMRADQAQLAVLRQMLDDAQLVAPINGVIRSRLMEPGEMASPQRPVFAISETDPKWVRAYVREIDLPHIRPGMAAGVTVDGFPHRVFKGWLGFISSQAEFTPKTVETAQLRTSLVYEVRVFVVDPDDDLRLGMPATVTLHLTSRAGAAR